MCASVSKVAHLLRAAGDSLSRAATTEHDDALNTAGPEREGVTRVLNRIKGVGQPVRGSQPLVIYKCYEKSSQTKSWTTIKSKMELRFLQKVFPPSSKRSTQITKAANMSH